MAIDPKLVSIKQASDLPSAIPTNAGEFLFFEDDTLQKSPMSDIYDRLESGINLGFITPSSPAAPATGIHRGQAVEAGTYTNFSGIVVTAADLDVVNGVANNRVILEVQDGVSTKRVERVKGDKGDAGKSTETWTAKTFTAGSTVYHLGTVWEAASDTLATDIPGTSAKWVEKIELIEWGTKTALTRNIDPEKYAYLDNNGWTNTDRLSVSASTLRHIVSFPFRLSEGSKIKVYFGTVYTPSGYEAKSLYFMNGTRAVSYVTLSAADKARGWVILEPPTEASSLLFSHNGTVGSGVSATAYSVTKRANADYYEGDNLLQGITFENSKYLNSLGQVVNGTATNELSDFIPVYSPYVELYGVNPRFGSGIFFYDSSKKLIGSKLRDELSWNTNPENTAYWDLTFKINIPENTRFIRFTHDRNYFSNLDNVTSYSNAKDVIFVFHNSDENAKADGENVNNNVYANLQTQKNLSLLAGSDITSTAKKIKIANKSQSGVGRVAFRFRFLEDVNNENSEKRIFSLRNAANTQKFDIVIKKAVTSNIIAKDSSLATSDTTYPIPQFNSGFGIRTDVASVDATRRTVDYPARGIKDITKETQISKPICGKQMFYLRFLSGDVADGAKQAALTQWADLTFTIDASEVKLTSVSNGLSVVSTITDFTSVRDLYFDFKGKIKASAVGSLVEAVSINIDSSYPIFTDARYDNFGLVTPTSALTRMSVPLISNYYNNTVGGMVKDSYPAYAFAAVDNSWHTLEFVNASNKDAAYFTVDGEYIILEGNYEFAGLRSVFKDGCTINIGEDIQIDVKDLIIEYDEYSDAEVRDVQPFSHKLVSSYHPYVIHFYGHDLYYCEDKNVPYEEFGKYHLYESEGGFIPDNLKNANPSYRGDDSIQNGRKGLAYPSWMLESVLGWIKAAGYEPVTNRQLAEFHRTGKPLPKRSFIIGFDDFPTYIYADYRLRAIFRKFGVRPYFALELGWYADDSISTYYNISNWITLANDTNEHRLKLQKRIQTMQNDEWEFVLHGAKEGFVHRGASYEELKRELTTTQDMALQMGIQGSWWCIAANMFTPNAIYMHDLFGVETSSATKMYGSANYQHPNYMGRTGWEFNVSSKNYAVKSKIL